MLNAVMLSAVILIVVASCDGLLLEQKLLEKCIYLNQKNGKKFIGIVLYNFPTL